MGTLAIQGAVVDLPSGETFRPIDERVPCDPAPSSRTIHLADDSPFDVSMDGLDGINALHLAADFPVTVILTSIAGTAQSIPAESMYLISRAVAITAISLVRVAGQVTTVRLILGQEA